MPYKGVGMPHSRASLEPGAPATRLSFGLLYVALLRLQGGIQGGRYATLSRELGAWRARNSSLLCFTLLYFTLLYFALLDFTLLYVPSLYFALRCFTLFGGNTSRKGAERCAGQKHPPRIPQTSLGWSLVIHDCCPAMDPCSTIAPAKRIRVRGHLHWSIC